MLRINTVAKCLFVRLAAVFSFVGVLCLCFGLSFVQADASDLTTAEQKTGIVGVYARLSEEITMKYEILLPGGYSSPEMVFSVEGKSFSNGEYETNDDGKIFFSYCVKPQNISKLVKAELYAVDANGEREKIDEKSYSLEKYCKELIESKNLEGLSGKKAYAAKLLATSVLKYGKAAEMLVYGESSETDCDFGRYEVKYEGEQLPKTKEATQSEEVVWKSAGVSFASGVSVYFNVRVKKQNGVEFDYSITSEGENYLDDDRIIKNENDNFIEVKFYSKPISPVCFKNEMTATVNAMGNRYGGECKYNVNSCIFNNMDNESLGKFVDSVFCYGKAAALYERIDDETMTFTSSGSLIEGDYALSTVCDGYKYKIAFPAAGNDCYDLTIIDEATGVCKYTLKRGEYYAAFGEIESDETTLNEAVVIDNKVYHVTDNDELSDDTDGKAGIKTNEITGGIELTFNSFASEEKLSVYSNNECSIILAGTNSFCYGSGNKSLYSTAKLSFSGKGILKSGAVNAKGISFGCSSWYINTGEANACEYALKSEMLDSSSNIEITTKNDYGVVIDGDMNIKDGGLRVLGATVGIKCCNMAVDADAVVYVSGQDGLLLTGKLGVSSTASVIVNAGNCGVKANKISLAGTLEITTKNSTALETAVADKNMFKVGCNVTIQRAEDGNAKIAVKVVSCAELIVRGDFLITDYKYYFYTDNERNDSELIFDSFNGNDDESTIKANSKGFLTE